MAATTIEEEVYYESDPEEEKQSMAMRSREASDDDEGEGIKRKMKQLNGVRCTLLCSIMSEEILVQTMKRLNTLASKVQLVSSTQCIISGLCVVFQTHAGELLRASSMGLFVGMDPLSAEARALLQGLDTDISVGFTRLCVESDCQRLIFALNSGDLLMYPQGVLLQEIRSRVIC